MFELIRAADSRANGRFFSDATCHNFNVFENILVGEEHIEAFVIVGVQEVEQG